MERGRLSLPAHRGDLSALGTSNGVVSRTPNPHHPLERTIQMGGARMPTV